jgi:hypothetical protein
MIYIFGNPENSLAVHLYSTSNTSATSMKVVRNKAPGISFEILTDKKTGLKVVGLSNVLNFLAGNMPNNTTHDFYCWLTTCFKVNDDLHLNTVASRIGESEILDYYLFSKLYYAQNTGFVIPDGLKQFYTQFSIKYGSEVEKYNKMNLEVLKPPQQSSKNDKGAENKQKGPQQ